MQSGDNEPRGHVEPSTGEGEAHTITQLKIHRQQSDQQRSPHIDQTLRNKRENRAKPLLLSWKLKNDSLDHANAGVTQTTSLFPSSQYGTASFTATCSNPAQTIRMPDTKAITFAAFPTSFTILIVPSSLLVKSLMDSVGNRGFISHLSQSDTFGLIFDHNRNNSKYPKKKK
eukprot:705726_1